MEKSLLKLYGSYAAFLAGMLAFLYALTFVVYKNTFWYSLLLMLGGLLTIIVMSALFLHIKKINGADSLVALVLGGIGGLGALLHGGYDLANAINLPATLNMDLPNQVDPRGLLTFGITGLAFALLWYIIRNSDDVTPTLKAFCGRGMLPRLTKIYYKYE